MTTDVKGGALARQAAMLCDLPVFGLYLDHRRRWRESLTTSQLPDGTHTPEDAADVIRQACGVESRAELDHNEWAGAMFKRIAADFGNWKRRREG